jgi:protoheme IX farnesyltransferase
MLETAKLLYTVFKVRIGLSITLCAMAGVAMTPGHASVWQIAVVALAVLVSSAGAGAFNQYVERDLDRHMERTRNRPFVTGRLKAGAYWPVIVVVLLLMSVAAVALAVNTISALYVFLGAFFYGIVYTVWLKRRSWTNIVLGGLAGSFAVLAGAAAVDPGLSPAPIVLAVVLFLWTPPHFWSLAMAYRDDYAQARVPMLPVVVGDQIAANVIVVHTVLLVALSCVPVLYGMGWIYLSGAAIGGYWFIRASVRLMRAPGRENAMRNFHASLIQLSLLLSAAIFDAWLLA